MPNDTTYLSKYVVETEKEDLLTLAGDKSNLTKQLNCSANWLITYSENLSSKVDFPLSNRVQHSV